MAFNRENISRVRAEYATRRQAAAEESDARKKRLYREIPSLAALDREISSIGVRVMQAAVSGQNVEAVVAAMRRDHEALRQQRCSLLEANGYPGDYTDIRYRCEKCMDTGFVGTRMCSCMRNELVLLGYERSGIGSLMQTQSFDTFNMDYYTGDARQSMEANVRALLSFSENFSDRRGDSWLLIGATGLGKTHLSTSVARRVIEQGWDVVYDTAQDMFSAYETERFGRGGTDGGDTEKYLSCDLLILDDLGTEMTNTFTVSCLYNLINHRLNHHRSTVLSTNLTHSELRARYADRITSRIFGEFRPLLFRGKDIRAQKLMQSTGNK